jgi:hypothetical protein
MVRKIATTLWFDTIQCFWYLLPEAPGLLSSKSVRVTNGKLVRHCEAVEERADRVERQLSGLNAALFAFAGVYAGSRPKRKKQIISAAGRKRIAAAQRARWAKLRAKKGKVVQQYSSGGQAETRFGDAGSIPARPPTLKAA